jgi:hypothetical protein
VLSLSKGDVCSAYPGTAELGVLQMRSNSSASVAATRPPDAAQPQPEVTVHGLMMFVPSSISMK